MRRGLRKAAPINRILRPHFALLATHFLQRILETLQWVPATLALNHNRLIAVRRPPTKLELAYVVIHSPGATGDRRARAGDETPKGGQ